MSENRHVTGHDLERYCLGMVAEEPELATVEEHLLWCHDCLDQLDIIKIYIGAIRRAAFRSGFEREF